MNLQRRLAAEGVGTALLLAAVVGSGIMGERLAGGNVAIALLANAIATGSTLVALILTFGPISGAHFNPAVTIADASQRGLSWRDVPLYITAQLIGRGRGRARRASHVWRSAVSIVATRSGWRSPAFQRVRCDIRTPRRYLGLLESTFGIRSAGGWSLHHGSVLVYGVDVICEPSSHRRASPDEHVCRDPAGRRSGLHRRPTRRRPRGDALLSLARSSIDASRRRRRRSAGRNLRTS